MDWNHEYAKVNGVNLHYVKEGNGKLLIVLLHGWPEFWYSWRYQIQALKDHYTVVAPDMRGFNLSEKPKAVSDYLQPIVAKDIVELVKHLGFEKATIVGHDWGGSIAWTIALNYPEITERFVVMNCPHPSVFIKNVKSNPQQLLKSWYMFFFQIPVLPELILGFDLKRFFTNSFRGWALNKNQFPDEELQKYVEAYEQPYALKSSINYYRANINPFTRPPQSKNRKVQAPTLMIWGTNDQALGEELVEGTERYINNEFTLKKIQGASHWVQNDCPDEVNQYLLEFLSKTTK